MQDKEKRFIAARAVIADALSLPQKLEHVLKAWDASVFDDDLHQKLWNAVKYCLKTHEVITLEIIIREAIELFLLSNEEVEETVDIASLGGGSDDTIRMRIAFYEKFLVRDRVQRAIEASPKAKDAEELKSIIADALESAEIMSVAKKEASLIGDNDDEFFAETERIWSGEQEFPSTGFNILDEENILTPGSLIVLGAQTSMGKSTFALNIADNVARRGKQVYIFSLEMSKREVQSKLLSCRMDIPAKAFNQPKKYFQDDRMWGKLVESLEDLKRLPIHIEDDDTEFTLASVKRSIEKFVSKSPCDLVIIDHLLLIQPNPDSAKYTRHQQIAEMTRTFKVLARKLKVPILLVTQLNRTVNESKDKRPALHHLKESSSVAEDANTVIFIHRDYMVNGYQFDTKFEADLILAKARFAETGSYKLTFMGASSRFEDLKPLSPFTLLDGGVA